MGTSSSGTGPSGGVSIVPPWADAAIVPPTAPVIQGQEPVLPLPSSPQTPPATTTVIPPVSPVAERGRFSAARRSAGEYSNSGSRDKLGRALGHHVRHGYGGSGTFSRRMSHSANISGGIFSAFTDLSSTGLHGGLHRDALVGRSAEEACGLLTNAICSSDGSLDSDLARDAFFGSLSEYMDAHPNCDLSSLGQTDILQIIEGFLSESIYQRVRIDLGERIISAAPSLATGMERLREVRGFVKEQLVSVMQQQVPLVSSVTASAVVALARQTIKLTAEIFEGYL